MHWLTDTGVVGCRNNLICSNNLPKERLGSCLQRKNVVLLTLFIYKSRILNAAGSSDIPRMSRTR